MGNSLRSVKVLGEAVSLTPLAMASQRALPDLAFLSYDFYTGYYRGSQYVFVFPKESVRSSRMLGNIAKVTGRLLDMPVVYVLPSCPADLCRKLVRQGTYFIVSDDYSFLPTGFVSLPRRRPMKRSQLLSPSAQYILLYHLLVGSLDGALMSSLPKQFPYSYAGIAQAVSQLSQLGLLSCITSGHQGKRLSFALRGRALFDAARPYMISPVLQRGFVDVSALSEAWPLCCQSAVEGYLGHSLSVPATYAVSKDVFLNLQSHGALRETVDTGVVPIEVWKHPPLSFTENGLHLVDRISLALSMPECSYQRDDLVDGGSWTE